MANLIIKSNIRKVVPKEMRVAINVAKKLNEVVEEILKKAAERAKANKRTTLMEQDL